MRIFLAIFFSFRIWVMDFIPWVGGWVGRVLEGDLVFRAARCAIFVFFLRDLKSGTASDSRSWIKVRFEVK